MSTIGHLDIKSTDLNRAQTFYESVLGVKFFKVSDTYIRASMKRKPDIALSLVDEVANGETFCPYLEVDDLHGATSVVRKLDGILVSEPWILEENKVEMIKVKDTEGNIIGLFRYL